MKKIAHFIFFVLIWFFMPIHAVTSLFISLYASLSSSARFFDIYIALLVFPYVTFLEEVMKTDEIKVLGSSPYFEIWGDINKPIANLWEKNE